MESLPYPINIGKKSRKWTAIDGQPVHVVIEDEIVLPQGVPPHTKLIYLQKLRFLADNRIEYRFTYYMEGYKGRTKGKWVFGQYSLVIPAVDLTKLLEQARLKQWEGF
jgi:hypothetical protein